MIELTATLAEDGTIRWESSSGGGRLGTPDDGLSFLFPVTSPDGLTTLVSENRYEWIQPAGPAARWLIDLDRAQEFFSESLSEVDWLHGQVVITPEWLETGALFTIRPESAP